MLEKIPIKSSDEIGLYKRIMVGNREKMTEIYLMISIKREGSVIIWADLDLGTGIGLTARL
jgi:hypothetical protein